MAYETLSDADLLTVAKDTLRGFETDHYRAKLTKRPGGEQHAKQLEDDIKRAKAEIARLEKVTNAKDQQKS